MENEGKKKNFNFYYQNISQKITVYEGTSQEEIISIVKLCFQIKKEDPILFLNDEGNVVVISFALPNEIKLSIQLPNNLQMNNVDSKKWIWMKNGSEAIFTDEVSFTTYDCEYTRVYGDIKFTKGIHYWTIWIEHIYCCHDLGITKEKLSKDFDVSYHTSCNTVVGLPGKFPEEDCGPSSTGCSRLNLKEMTIGCYLDMDKKLFVIANETKKQIYTKVNFNFSEAIPFYTSRKHTVKIKLTSCEEKPPSWLLDKII